MVQWPKWPFKEKKNYFFHFSVAGPKFRYDSQKVRQKLAQVHVLLNFSFNKKVAKKMAKS